jgi:hypothetical protein
MGSPIAKRVRFLDQQKSGVGSGLVGMSPQSLASPQILSAGSIRALTCRNVADNVFPATEHFLFSC